MDFKIVMQTSLSKSFKLFFLKPHWRDFSAKGVNRTTHGEWDLFLGRQ